MSNIIRCLLAVLILAFSLTAHGRPPGAGSGYDVTLNLPPISMISKVTIVLSPETAFLAGSGAVWTLIPRVSLIPKTKSSDLTAAAAVREDNKIDFTEAPSAYPYTDENNNFLGLDDSVVALAKDLADPIYTFMMDDNISTENPDAYNYLYADVSMVVLSHFVRGITKNQMDVHLLTDPDSGNHLFINGLELGIRPDPLFGLRIRVREDNETTYMNSYGLELHLYPTENMAFKLLHDDNSTEHRTGVEFNMKF